MGRAVLLVVLFSAVLAAWPSWEVESPLSSADDRSAAVNRVCSPASPHAGRQPDTGPRLECASPDAYRVGPSQRTLVLTWATGLARVVAADIRESRERVRIGIVQAARRGPIGLLDLPYRVTVELRRPLGDRHVVGATTGRPVDPRRPGPPATRSLDLDDGSPPVERRS